MNVSEIIILLLVYSGLLIFFLSPYREIEQIKESNDQVFFRSVFKNNLVNIVFQKKALFALMLLAIALISIQLLFDGAEWHYNAHSGYPSISNKLPAFFVMGSVVIYTIILLLSFAYMKTIKNMKEAKELE